MSALAPDTITLPDPPTVPGLRFRHFRGESDYAGLVRSTNAARAVDTRDWVLTLDDVVREYNHLVNSDPAQDMIIAELDDDLIGYARGEWWAETSGDHRYWVHPVLDPAYRGNGIRRAMLRWLEARYRVIAAAHPPDVAKTFRGWAPPYTQDMAVLLESEGYQPVRYFFKMTHSLDGPITDFPLPEGLELRPVLPEHYRAIWDADNEAFRDHWGHFDPPEAFYQEWLEDKVIFTPELWQVAWDVETNEIAGQVRTFVDRLENETFGRNRGYTEFISVRRPYRRRGLARALIVESLRLQKSLGLTESALSVDTENPTGATRVYAECGFAAVERSAAYHKAM
jgi:GNAT superfamily N-acetyltransferase